MVKKKRNSNDSFKKWLCNRLILSW